MDESLYYIHYSKSVLRFFYYFLSKFQKGIPYLISFFRCFSERSREIFNFFKVENPFFKLKIYEKKKMKEKDEEEEDIFSMNDALKKLISVQFFDLKEISFDRRNLIQEKLKETKNSEKLRKFVKSWVTRYRFRKLVNLILANKRHYELGFYF